MLEAVQHKSLKEEIFEVLHDQIITGKFVPGDWLRQDEIASQLGVSMTPVREALDLLVAAGLAERLPYRGVRILQLSTHEIAEAYGLRLMLEGIAAREAATCISDAEIKNLNHIIGQMGNQVSLSDMPRARQLSREFHKTIVEASGNLLLAKIYTIVANTFPDWMLYESLFRHPELLESSLAREQIEHSSILQALSAHDPQQAFLSAIDHVKNLGRDMEHLLDIPASLLESKEINIIRESNPKKEAV